MVRWARALVWKAECRWPLGVGGTSLANRRQNRVLGLLLLLVDRLEARGVVRRARLIRLAAYGINSRAVVAVGAGLQLLAHLPSKRCKTRVLW